MLKLSLTKNTKKASKLTRLILDIQWQLLEISYNNKDHNELILANGQRIVLDSEIIKHINKITRTSRFKNIIQAFKRVFTQLVQNKSIYANKQLIKSRQATCETCPFKNSKFLITKCTICGCVIRAKTKLATESCPLEKW